MRILIVTSELHEEAAGGAGIYVFQLCKELVRQGHEVDVIADVTSGSKLTAPFKLYRVKLSELPILGFVKWGVEAYICSRKLMETKKYDVVNVHGPLNSSVFSLIGASGVPMVINMHVGWHWTNPRYPIHKKFFYFLVDMFLSVKAKKFIVLNKSFGRNLLRCGFSQDKLVFVPNAVDWKRFAVKLNRNSVFRKKFRIPSEATVLLYVGRIVKGKGIEVLLNATRMLPDTLKKDLWVVIVGDGALRSRLMEEYKDLENVVFTGSLWKDDKISAYQESDLFVVPSEVGEGMPTVIFEAMAAGLPIISTRIPGTVEIIKKEFGMLVNPKDSAALARAISEMISDKRALLEMGAKASSFSRRFDWSIITKQIAELFESCADLTKA